VKRLVRDDLDRAQIYVLAASPGPPVVRIEPAALPESAEWQLPTAETAWTEVAMTDLLRVLPESDDEDEAVESLLAAEPVLRRCVADLVQSGGHVLDVGFDLRRPNMAPIQSKLSSAQARKLRTALNIFGEERATERRRGRSDGLRTRQRILYLEVKHGSDIHGIVMRSCSQSSVTTSTARLT
jgi:hypothetical protein